jgi:hypothetical protein
MPTISENIARGHLSAQVKSSFIVRHRSLSMCSSFKQPGK